MASFLPDLNYQGQCDKPLICLNINEIYIKLCSCKMKKLNSAQKHHSIQGRLTEGLIMMSIMKHFIIISEAHIIISPVTASEKLTEVLKECVQDFSGTFSALLKSVPLFICIPSSTHGKSPAPPWPPGFVPWRRQPGICKSQRPR